MRSKEQVRGQALSSDRFLRRDGSLSSPTLKQKVIINDFFLRLDENKAVYIKAKDIADACECSTNLVRSVIQDLVKGGFIEVRRAFHESEYSINKKD